jgi:hypothetical protein
MKNDIHLELWWTDMNRRLSSFHAYWNSKNLKDKENFPINMGLGDWDEQFSIFVEHEYDAAFGTKTARERANERFKN